MSTNDELQTMRGLIHGVQEEVAERFGRGEVEGLYNGDVHAMVHEIADGWVPVYYSDLFDIAANDNEVALRAPEAGPAFDGTATPVNIIAANIFEMLEEAAWEELERLRKDAQAQA